MVSGAFEAGPAVEVFGDWKGGHRIENSVRVFLSDGLEVLIGLFVEHLEDVTGNRSDVVHAVAGVKLESLLPPCGLADLEGHYEDGGG